MARERDGVLDWDAAMDDHSVCLSACSVHRCRSVLTGCRSNRSRMPVSADPSTIRPTGRHSIWIHIIFNGSEDIG